MSNIKLFEERKVRATWDNTQEKWYFVVQDVVEILTGTVDAKDYIKKMKKRDPELAKGWGQIVPPLSIDTPGGKQKMGCADTKGIFRIIQSIPSPKAEPFKRWLAQVGSERLEEIENPEIATQRTRELYKLKGYPDDWIEKRMRSIAIREELTDEWKNHGVKEKIEYSILTAEISKATFGFTPSEYKQIKGLKSQNLRDHFNDLELIFSMLGEASTTAIVRTQHPKGFVENKQAARQGGKIAGDARRALELKTGENVVSTENFLPETKKAKALN
ncbi:MAG: Bro-N domain-containing protein [Prevotellaceae bacterium]|jgi:prophage antirepressor-like protein|nr:Bro-N domain-containing protein [Prevotellaceae bacterium]